MITSLATYKVPWLSLIEIKPATDYRNDPACDLYRDIGVQPSIEARHGPRPQ
jgi:hypothetical protein